VVQTEKHSTGHAYHLNSSCLKEIQIFLQEKHIKKIITIFIFLLSLLLFIFISAGMRRKSREFIAEGGQNVESWPVVLTVYLTLAIFGWHPRRRSW